MLQENDYKPHLPDALFAQIKQICDLFRTIQSEAAGIMQDNNMPDSASQLQDVLQATEKATDDILNAALAIQEYNGEPEILAEVTKIMESCAFQDLTGQRIKKVLRNLGLLDEQFVRLAQAVQLHEGHNILVKPIEPENLARGPQLTEEAPNQDDIDALFKSIG